MLPVFFIVLASAALVAALAALFASLRASFGGPTDPVWSAAGPDRGALADEKNALLRALKDLEYEHEVGKIDDEDYAKLERAYRARAKEVLGELDRDLRPYLSRAEALAGEVVGATDNPYAETAASEGKKGKKKRKKGEAAIAEPAKSESESATAVTSLATESDPVPSATPATVSSAPPVCAKCATANDADASFCKKCATPLTAPSTETTTETTS